MIPGLLALSLLTTTADETPNLASASRGAVVTRSRNASGSAGKPMAANDGDVTGYGANHGYAWGWFTEPLTVTFLGTVTLNKVEVLLLDVDARAYDLRLEVRAGGEWRPLEERKRASGWVTFVFGQTECSAIRLVFTGGTLPVKSYHVVEVAAYDDPKPEQDSALKKAWLNARKERGRGELGLLGVDEALEAVFLKEAAFQRAKALKEGERRWIDLDRDGDPDLIVLKDQGAVVVVIDDDDDARLEAPEADRDSDCWVVDLDLDGRPDRVFDYIDDDGDGDADREQHTYLHFGWFGSRPGLVLIWDYDDDGGTWVLNRYSYEQGRCQWGCDFGGDGGFSLFRRDPRTGTWEADWECPFYFYDPDRDGLAEEAVRLEGHGRHMRALRYSMNADNDVTEGQPYDYDFAVVALGPVELPEEWLVTTPLRVGETGPYLPYSTAREAVRKLPWQKTLLVWDENDINIDPADRAKHERWEGVINSRYDGFPQIGGPACGLLNKRYELDADNSGGLRLYASAVDGRLHLYGAEKGTMWIDAGGNRKADRIVEYVDTDGDGCFDEWRFDDDADGVPERTFRVQGTLIRAEDTVPLEWGRVVGTYVPLLRRSVAGHAAVAEALGAPLTPSPGNGNLEHSRWALETRVTTEFNRQISAARTVGDAVRAGRLERARESWERGLFDEAAALIGRGADASQP
jgi:hypothetical protein